MSTFANQLKTEIARIAKKEIKTENAALKKASSQYRSDIAALKRRITALENALGKVAKQAGKSIPLQEASSQDKPL